MIVGLLLIVAPVLLANRTRAQDSNTPATLAASANDEWFEREVRPLLAERCLSCHSSTLEAPKANLKLDRREFMLQGGDSGTAIVAGKPSESLLVQAVLGKGLSRMPPDKPLTRPEIATLEKWIELGAPWPQTQTHSVASGPDWLKERAATHWCWQPLRDVPPRLTEQSTWTARPLDAYIASRLDALDLKPAGSVTPTQLLRRLSYDLRGLPPTRAELDAFEQAIRESEHASHDSVEARERLIAQTVDRMLASPEFGVTWGRHWFDLVRYCETLGHEFDYPVRHAWRYRDAVIDALNDDVPYSRIVQEHLAGDLLTPRRHIQSDINQSLAMTGWWWMGEGLHAPVDVWGDEATRLDNQIDVYSKAFLGLTVACARCHDHKFDAISSADYTSLVGILQSSHRVYAMDDPRQSIDRHSQRIEQAIDAALINNRAANDPNSTTVPSAAEEMALEWINQLAAKLKSPDEAKSKSPDKDAIKSMTLAHPLLPMRWMAQTSSDVEFESQRTKAWSSIKAKQAAFDKWYTGSKQLASFEHGLPEGWTVESTCSTMPTVATSKRPWMLLEPAGLMPARSGLFASHVLGRQQQLALRSPTFDVTTPAIALRMRGKSAQSAVIVDNYFMIEFHGLLFGDLKKPIDQPYDWGWVTHAGDLKKYLGHSAYISIDDDENSWFELAEVRLCDGPPPESVSPWNERWLQKAMPRNELARRMAHELAQACRSLTDATAKPGNELEDAISLVRAAIVDGQRYEVPFPIELVANKELHNSRKQLEDLAAATPSPARVLAMREGTPRNAPQFVRGNPHKRGDAVMRGDLQALGGLPVTRTTSSGRRELAESLTSGAHPLASRVMVNRVWLQLFGQGLVDSPDNFGLLGGAPSHPELLDRLSCLFMEHDWSIKWLVREICLSQTYRLSSTPTPEQLERDPTARYLSHRIVRRLSGEKLRDAMLQISGSLDEQMGGESIKVHLTEQMSGRGRPGASGPLDGAGRRAVYVETRRNFLDPFLVAFDQPPPATTVGKRNVSNVPAQALSMLNDPLVHELVDRWSQRVTEQKLTREQAIDQMFRSAFSRSPTEPEQQACAALMGQDSSASALRELAHVLLCAKEFQYLP